MSKIVERTLNLLELFAAERRPLSLSDIARLMKIPVSSCHDVLQAMQARGYLYELAPRAGFYPTLRLLEMGRVFSEHDPVVARADLLLRSLRKTLDETVLLAKVTGTQATYLLAFEASHPLRFMIKVGDRVRSLHATSGGKALLANLGKEVLDTFLRENKLSRLTARTHTTRAALRADLEAGRARGWHLNDGESLDDVTTLSSCFHWNGVGYIVSVAGPTTRLAPKLQQATAQVMNICRILEQRPGAA